MPTPALPPPRTRPAACLLGPLLACVGALAQAPGEAGEAAKASERRVEPGDVADAILTWVLAFDTGDVRLEARIRVAEGAADEYVRLGLRGGALDPEDGPRALSNFAILQRLVEVAERYPGSRTAAALLALAATGYGGHMFDRQVVMVRDLGHFALLRAGAPAVWAYVHDVAAGEQRPEAIGGVAARFSADAHIMWRVAAVRLLGMKDQRVFRSTIEDCLENEDSRVRLAAAEALGALRRPQSLPAVARVLSGETDPMVAAELVQTVHRILDRHASEIEADRSGLALRTALGRLGEVDWRTDIAVAQLVQSHPIKAAAQPMIALMRNARGESDPILKIINANASRMLAHEAHLALRRLTGAPVPEDPDRWQAFWQEEKDHIVVRRPVRRSETHTVSSGGGTASFYGIPVLGSNVVFVLDTSGSMKEQVQSVYRGPLTGPDPPRAHRLHGTRLQIARYQTLKAVQGMPRNTRFSIVTFDSTVHVWNQEPVRVRRSSRSTAAGILWRLRPRGGTNLFDALMHVLDAENVRYGQVSKSGVDEVFVLSDGEPSSGRVTATGEILEWVAEINRFRKVRINTVFAGTGKGAGFMRQLAQQNGGVFVQQ